MTSNAELAAAAKRLDDLAAELDQRGFAARVLATGGKLRMWVQNRSVYSFPMRSTLHLTAMARGGCGGRGPTRSRPLMMSAMRRSKSPTY